MKLHAIAAARLGGLQLPFVRRSRLAAIIGELKIAEERAARLERDNADLRKSVAAASKSDGEARDEVERLRVRNIQLNADAARRESEITRLKSESERLIWMVERVRVAVK